MLFNITILIIKRYINSKYFYNNTKITSCSNTQKYWREKSEIYGYPLILGELPNLNGTIFE